MPYSNNQPLPPVPVLIVDDRKEDLLAIETLLAGPEYLLVTALGGRQALRRLLETDFAVILLDARMPDIDGFELATLVKQRERSRHTPLIFLTADYSDVPSIHRAYSVGAVDYLLKPIDAKLLRAKVAIFADLFRKDLHIQRQAAALREADRRERELERAELELASRARYQNLAEAIPQIVWTATPDGSVDYCNQRWYDYTGLDAKQTLGHGWLAALHPDDARSCERCWRTAVHEALPYQVHCRLVRHEDGSPRWHLGRAVPELDATGKVLAWLGTYTDFEDLKRALDARDEFLSIASHELRTPMTALQLQLQSLRRLLDGADRSSQPSTKVDKAIAQVQRLVRLTDDILDVSRISSGHLRLQRTECDLTESVREVVERSALQAEKAGCKVSVRGGSVVGCWDRLRVEQITTNLLSNALKYAPGEPIEIFVDRGPEGASLTVRDHGPGIAPEDLDRVFDRFERAASARNKGGLGLGLFITREIVQAHGGAISVTNEDGAGAVFRVDLPLDEEGAEARHEAGPSSLVLGGSASA